MSNEIIASYLKINDKYRDLSELEITDEINRRQEIIEERFASNHYLKDNFFEIIRLLTSSLFMNDEILSSLISVPNPSFEKLKNFLVLLINENLLSRQNLALTLQYFESEPDKMLDMVNLLNQQGLLSENTLITALSKEANELFWPHIQNTQVESRFINKLLKSCQFLYENESLFKHTLCTVTSMLNKSPKDKLMGLDKAFTTLNKKGLLTFETISMLVATEEKYTSKVKGIIFLSERNLLEVAHGQDVYYGKFGERHLELMQLLDNQELLNEELVKLILKVRKGGVSYSIFDILEINYFYKESLKNSDNIPRNVIYQLLTLEHIPTCSLLDVIKIIQPSFQLENDDWQRLENEYNKLFKANTSKHNISAYSCLMSIWDILIAKGYHGANERAWLLEGQIRILSKRKSREGFPKRELLNGLLQINKKYSPEITKALLLSTRLEHSDDWEHPLNFLWNNCTHKVDAHSMLLNPILFRHFIENYLLPEHCDTVNFKKSMDIYQHFRTHAQHMLADPQWLQKTVSTENLQQTSQIIKRHTNAAELVNIFDDLFTYRDHFVDDEGDLLNAFLDIPLRTKIPMTQWQEIFNICRNNNLDIAEKRNAISVYIQNWHRNITQGERPQLTVNERQSTHTASVHIGTNITLWVMALYANKTPAKEVAQLRESKIVPMLAKAKATPLTCEAKYQLDGLIKLLWCREAKIKVTSEEKHRCLAFIKKEKLWEGEPIRTELEESANYSANLSIGVFLHFIYHHIMTTKSSAISDEDVFNALLKLGYETLRGYNINDKGIDTDLNAPSRPMCVSGTFNKACEIFKPFSNMILFYFVSDSSIMLKSKCLLLEKFSNHIDALCLNGRVFEAQKMMKAVEGDDPGSVFETFLETHSKEITTEIVAEFSNFKTQPEIDKILVNFKNEAVPYYCSPMMDNAQEIFTPSFVEWFKTKRNEMANFSSATSTSSSLFGQSSETAKRSISDAGILDNSENPEEKRARKELPKR